MINLGNTGLRIDQEPNCCPVCNHIVSPNRIDVTKEIALENQHWTTHLEMLYECPSSKCGHLFLAHYVRKSEKQGSINAYFSYSHSTPSKFIPKTFDDRICKVSSRFTEIYNQSSHAETLELNDICGMGYRKSLEFLIKDYCIRSNPDDIESIKKMLLMQCINKYVTDNNIKNCATRAAWLGNDESHYEKIWMNKDIQDLKTLINLAVHWIISTLMTEEYLESMQK